MSGYSTKGHILIGFQDSGGVTETGSYTAIPFVNESINLLIEPIQESNNYGRFVQSPTHAGTALVEGSINMEADPVALGALIKSVLNNYSFTGSQHIFRNSTYDFDGKYAGHPITGEVHVDVGDAYTYYDLQAKNIELSQEVNELLTAKVEVIGGGYERNASTTPSFNTSKPFKWDQVSAQIDDAAVIDFTGFGLIADKNIEARYTLNTSNVPTVFKRVGTEKVEITGTLLFQSHSYQQAFEEYGTHDLRINFVAESSTLLFEAPNFRFTEFSPNISGQGIIEADFAGVCEYNTGSATAIKIELDNIQNTTYGKVYFTLDHPENGELNGTYNLLN